jgi:exodeoxyribonuclease VII small subunit
VNFEERLARLERIASELEGDELELARALALFEEGVEHLRLASAELAEAEVKLEQLVERADGTLRAIDVDDDE